MNRHSLVSRISTLFLPIRMAYHLGRGAARLRMLQASYAVLFSIALGSRRGRRVTLIFRGKEIPLVLESSADFALVREIFLDEEYRHEHLDNPRFIFDVGANIGVASLYFHCLYPDATVYAFEPDPILFRKLAMNVGGTGRIIPLQMALADANGLRPFYPSASPLAGSLMPRAGSLAPLEVTVRTLASVADELNVANIDLVKFDIEGGESLLFASAQDRTRAKRLIGEVHLDLLGTSKKEFSSRFPEFITRFERGLTPFRLIFWGVRREARSAV